MSALPLLAQSTFTSQVQVNSADGPSLVIHQSQALEDLVNGVVRNGLPPQTENPTHRAAASGYRVQVVSADKQTAMRAKSRAASICSDQAAYVAFVSPRWTCRVGDFPTRAEAQECLEKFRRAGFREAIIVPSKIVIKY